jgi:ketosteroid isomerase-like protein
MSQENVEVVRRFQDAYNRGDRDAVATVIHPDVEWHTMAGPLLGVDAISGRQEALNFIFDRIPEGVEDFTATTDRTRELPGGQLLAVGAYTGRGVSSGAKIEMTAAALYRFEEGMIVFFRDFASEAEALEAAGLSE